MKADPYPSISSFVIPFVQDQDEVNCPQPGYRGSIRHVQTDNEIGFTRWDDAVAFMQKYVPIKTDPPTEIEFDGKK